MEPAQRLYTSRPPFSPPGSRRRQDPQLAGSAALAALSLSVVTPAGRLYRTAAAASLPTRLHAPPTRDPCYRRACAELAIAGPAPLCPARPAAPWPNCRCMLGCVRQRGWHALALVLPRWPTPGLVCRNLALEACKRCESTTLHPCRKDCMRCQTPCHRCRRHSACQRSRSARSSSLSENRRGRSAAACRRRGSRWTQSGGHRPGRQRCRLVSRQTPPCCRNILRALPHQRPACMNPRKKVLALFTSPK